jgi:hypothetical protein
VRAHAAHPGGSQALPGREHTAHLAGDPGALYRAHIMTDELGSRSTQIGTYALVPLDKQNAGSGAVRVSVSCVVMYDLDVSVALGNRRCALIDLKCDDI